jgi:ATP-dependent Lhr-like helicase
MSKTLDKYKPAYETITGWYASRGWEPFKFQTDVWEAYLKGYNGLIHSATGTGKTYAGWLGPVIEWLQKSLSNEKRHKPEKGLKVIWITPIRSLANDIVKSLRIPVEELNIPWAVEARTGDTTTTQRLRQKKNFPDALVTTPESLTLLLSQADTADIFKNVKCVVVDEWHELLSSKRGVMMELALARIRKQNPDIRVWGISATIGNLDIAMQTLLGNTERRAKSYKSKVVRGQVPKKIVIDSIIPDNIEVFPWAGHIGLKLLDKVVKEIEKYRSVIVFTNTRSFTEIWYQAILDIRPDWAGIISLHHGSLDRDVREFVENGLRTGKLKCVISTSSLDLGVDFSSVDRVIQIGSPKGVARLLQRAGRSGHQPGSISRVTCVPTHSLELIEVAAVRAAAEEGHIESRYPVEQPLDLLVQHLVSMALTGFRYEEMFGEILSTYSYRNLTVGEFDWALDFITRGGNMLGAYDEYRKVTLEDGLYKVTDRRIAYRHRMTIGTIVSDSALVVKYVKGSTLGTIEESFIARLRPGDKFTFAGKILELVRVREMTAWVKRAASAKGVIPRWDGGRLPLSSELSNAIRDRLEEARNGRYTSREMDAVFPILDLQAKWSVIPAAHELLIEHVETDEGHHIFIFPFEGRLVHEGLSALLAYRISKITPITFSIAMNDYGFELLAPDPIPLQEALSKDLFANENLVDDIRQSLNASELARRQFREVARIAGLVFQGYPGSKKSTRQLQASSGLFYDMFAKYDPENLLVYQANREVLEKQLEQSRLGKTLDRIQASKIIIKELERPSPLSFPILVDGLRQKVSSEKLEARVKKMKLNFDVD